MAKQPTLDDVLRAIVKLETKVDAHRVETAKSFKDVQKQLSDLDEELTKHAGVHRELEKDVEALKRRPLRPPARAPRRRIGK